MSTRETWQIITCQKRLFDLNSNGLGVFSGTTNYLLMALAGVGMASGDLAVVVIISSMVLISGGLRFMLSTARPPLA